MRILIAESNELTGVLMKALLEQEGHRASLVLDGLHALTMLESERFDLVISEILLPYYTGLEVLHMVNQLESRPHVIILSAVQNINTVYRAYQMGIDLYMTKPFDPDQLPREIEKIRVA